MLEKVKIKGLVLFDIQLEKIGGHWASVVTGEAA